MRPLNNPDLRVYDPGYRKRLRCGGVERLRESRERGPRDVAIVVGSVIAIVALLIACTGCGAPPEPNRTRKQATRILAESAIARQPLTPAEIDELPNYRAAPQLPAAADAYTVPMGGVPYDDPAPTWEPAPAVKTRQTPNAGPCEGDNCPRPTVRRGIFGRWR